MLSGLANQNLAPEDKINRTTPINGKFNNIDVADLIVNNYMLIDTLSK